MVSWYTFNNGNRNGMYGNWNSIYGSQNDMYDGQSKLYIIYFV